MTLTPFRAVFKGVELTLQQKTTVFVDPVCPTGGHVWPSALSLLRFLETVVFPPYSIFVDLSAGCGLVSLALTLLGGKTYSLEIHSALPLLQANCPHSTCEEFYWGHSIPSCISSEEVYLTVACDLLYCAVRDGVERELAKTLVALSLHSRRGTLIVWEPRKEADEFRLLTLAEEMGEGLLKLSYTKKLDGGGLGGGGGGSPEGEIFYPPSLFPDAEEGLTVLAVTLSRDGDWKHLFGCV